MAAIRWRWRRGRRCSTSILEPGFLDGVKATGERLRATLEQMIPNHDHLFDSVRGMGLMLGVKLKSDSRAFVAHARDNHQLLLVAAGENVVRVLPPLVIEQGHIDEFASQTVGRRADVCAGERRLSPFSRSS